MVNITYIIFRYEKMWVSRTPEELIWGYPEPLFDLATIFEGNANIPPDGKFGFFTKVCKPLFIFISYWINNIYFSLSYIMVISIMFVFQKNDTANLPTYTMYTGEGNPYNLSEIYLVNGKSSLEKWGGKSPEQQDNACNVVRGSDGSTFNPYLQKVSRQNHSNHGY